ncbi:cytochrome C [Rufibacter sp. DG15C]|uniref:heme-binding domain-containing protein n=1 Tax=Rufibacter sp. DG15C TaxID=1379909 RepID=UPI00078DC249|nr:heme-binding domain-containing protein [Rufibacter sp. DG15C]AMM52854.1 cytochrome C [Rufibacter sp. DG15C]
MKTKTKILWAIVGLLVLIQFIRIDKTNPPADPAQDFITLKNPPQEVAHILKASCYDCHSNHTTYPWYTNVAPVSWWVKRHINEGRDELNFSEWGNYTAKRAAHKLDESYELVAEGEMPLSSYTLIHANARLSEPQKQQLLAWLKTQGAKAQ